MLFVQEKIFFLYKRAFMLNNLLTNTYKIVYTVDYSCYFSLDLWATYQNNHTRIILALTFSTFLIFKNMYACEWGNTYCKCKFHTVRAYYLKKYCTQLGCRTNSPQIIVILIWFLFYFIIVFLFVKIVTQELMEILKFSILMTFLAL